MKKSYFFLFIVLFITMLFSSQKATAQYTIPTKMNWWYESRFGMFIHFGSYSYLAQGEWAMSGNYTKTTYQTQVSKNFNPTKFNGGTIARLAKKSRYEIPGNYIQTSRRFLHVAYSSKEF